jgi:arginyl-tRNA synthetase
MEETLRRRVTVAIADALADAQRRGDVPDASDGSARFDVTRPERADHGDFASNVGLKLAGSLKQPPRTIAEAVATRLTAATTDGLIERAEVAGPGFVNAWLGDSAIERAVDALRGAGEAYGRAPAAALSHLNVEFVSANPTGPLTIGNARGAFVGDLLSRVAEAAGHRVTREYYFNDAGTQVNNLGGSVRSNGLPTYFAADIGYLLEKLSRGFDELVYVWGADHHGTVPRLKGAAEALGFSRDQVQVLLIAWVRFVRDGQEISMSKRSGEFITLDELLEEVGVDAARWYFASRAPSTGIDFDIELARKQSNENPVYYVQYAHARISSILRKAEAEGIAPAASLAGSIGTDAVARGLARELLDLPDVVGDAAAVRETQGITAYATSVATTFHAYYRDRRVVDPDDPATSAARLALVDATRITLAATLSLLGISAPDSM